VKISKEFKIGLVVVCAIAALVWGISFLKGSNLFTEKYYLYAVYPKIDNLIPANPVQINGYKIGQINKISLIDFRGKKQVLVKFLLSEDIAIPLNSIARAVSADLLGTKAVEILMGDSAIFANNGDTLRAETEQGLKESFNKQIAPLQAKAENLIGSIDSAMTLFNMVLNTKTRANIDQTFESVRKAILSLEQTAYKVDDLVAYEKPKMSAILTNLSGITQNLNKNEQKITNALTNFSNLSDSISKARLSSAVNNADNTLRELNVLMAKINQGQGTLGKLAKNDSLYNNLNKSAEDLDKLLKDLKENPKRYVHFSIFGKKEKKTEIKP
jgi:phospholipid/cholesterol/gamma-HCH transport system substrate-binding protein